MKVLGVAGSLLPRAYVTRLLEASGRELPASADFEVWDGLEGVPPFRDGSPPSSVEELCHTFARADGLLITAPAHSVLPPQLGHVLDWLSSEHGGTALLGKPVVVVTACARPHESAWTQTRLRRALGAAGAVVHGADLTLTPALRRFDSAGRITDPVARERLREVLGPLRPMTLTITRV